MVEPVSRLDRRALQGRRLKTHAPNTYCPIEPPFYVPEKTGGVNGRWWLPEDVERWADKYASGEFSCTIGYYRFHCYPSYCQGPVPFTCRAMGREDSSLVLSMCAAA